MSSNKTVAEHLRLIAQLSALDGKNRFQIKAFEEAVVTIIALGDQDRPVLIEKLVKEKALRDIPNIGESVASVIEEFLKTGTSARLKDLGTRWPVEAMSMIAVNTVGPKTAMKLYREQGIHNFDELVLAAKEGKLKEKLAQEVLAADRRVQGRVPHDNAKFLAEKLLEEMKSYLAKAEICGSIRRNTIDSKDIDIVAIVAPDRTRKEVFEAFAKLGEGINTGEAKASIRIIKYGIEMQADIWLVEPSYWGSALVYATGSRDHCVALRTLAKSRNQLINEYGIFKLLPDGSQEKLGGEHEQDVYQVLGLKYFEPVNRTGDLS